MLHSYPTDRPFILLTPLLSNLRKIVLRKDFTKHWWGEHLTINLLQHFSATSYAIISNLANGPVSPSFDSISHRYIAEQLTKLTRLVFIPFQRCGVHWHIFFQLFQLIF